MLRRPSVTDEVTGGRGHVGAHRPRIQHLGEPHDYVVMDWKGA
jgi:hypothetical protein